MIANAKPVRKCLRLAQAFGQDRRGAAAVEFALLGLPFLLLLICIMQMGLYYMTQVALNAGTVKAAENLRSVFGTGATPVTPSGATLKSTIVSGSGTGIVSSGLIVEVQPLANLGAGTVAITDGLTSYGSAWTPLVLRAKYTFSTFMPGFAATWSINSSALVRRQGQ
ncbi:MAG TPA: TadE/TadG family type IV pilus assembly protein [Caulobacteraceae bacterium]|nr:TadE/TadG family type IV pilus assembly protein [Caulobacteraceae bacterium]